jgi:flagellar hook assembly protein FlgD
VAPNLGTGPFRVDFGLPAAGRAAVDVYDAGGRRVRALAEGPVGSGRHSLLWDGRDGAGTTASPGVYFVRLRSGGRDAVRRLALVR